jgi:hypothetical protein
VLGLGEQVEQNARAGVNADVDNTDDNITISVTTLDNSDYVLVRGINNLNAIETPNSATSGGISDSAVYLSETGSNVEISGSGSGTLTIVAVIGDDPGGSSNSNGDLTGDNPPESATQTTVQQVDYDFS